MIGSNGRGFGRLKRLAVVLLCAIMVVSSFGCDNTGNTEGGASEKPSTVATATATADAEEKETGLLTEAPTLGATEEVTEEATEEATAEGTPEATDTPTEEATEIPSETATAVATEDTDSVTTDEPTEPVATSTPHAFNTLLPTKAPTAAPTKVPTAAPTKAPTAAPTKAPTAVPTKAPTAVPTKAPTATPTKAPTAVPTVAPTPVPEPTEIPALWPENETVSDTDYSLTFYWGPEMDNFTEAEIIRMKEAGFDIIPIQRFPWEYDKIKEVVKLLDKHGLKAAVRDGRMVELMEGTAEPTAEKIEEKVLKIVDFYKDCDNIAEWILYDEPGADKFSRLATAVKYFRQYSPNTKTYINLLPGYATTGQLQASNYTTYVQEFIKEVNPDYLCTDYYAFLSDGRRTDWAYTMNTLKIMGQRYGLETRFIALVSQHVPYKNVTLSELYWQANLSLLYGMKSLSWFTYSHENGYSNELIDVNGNATKHYYEVQTVNKTVRVLGNALYNTEVDKIFYAGNENTRPDKITAYKEYGRLGALISSKDMLISFYDNGYIMLMSNVSSGSARSTITAEIVRSLQWLNPETATWESISSCPFVSGNTVSLGAGDAILVR